MFKRCTKQRQGTRQQKAWIQEKVDKAGDETINKTYTEYKQRELNEKGEKTGKALDKHVISLYSIGISQMVKINENKRDVKKLQQDTEKHCKHCQKSLQ